MAVFRMVTVDPRGEVPPRLAPPAPRRPAPLVVAAAAAPAPKTSINRTYWTKRRVVDGLRRVALELGATPSSSEAYHELVRLRGVQRRAGRYPSIYAVLRWFGSLREAWEAAGYQQDRWWESWSELEDWYLREGAGILTRNELAADLRRSPDAVHRRLYDLGIHTWERWGWTAHRVERLAGIPRSVLKRYMDRGDLPYLRGTKVLYVDPADLVVVEELDWEGAPAELVDDVRRTLQRRILASLAGADWQAGRPHQPHPLRSTGRRWSLRLSRPTARPAWPRVGDLARCNRPVGARPLAAGRIGTVKVVFWSSVRNKLRERVEPGWFARVEFPKLRIGAGLPRVTYTLPVEVLERSDG